ncbi:alpha/beta hydrolase [Lujinxingia litoralis]|uniref:Alpha/beta hydrolase n=1 Tax=Lujinxingia litoralis TaxID=2211119 RepID=A0A328C5S3_9DELT|nr:alpha/beta hydrolase [Lujinxingia litoralis]RAL20360.1 alpha/beta hydrolase [Lujinxingia litoralis]
MLEQTPPPQNWLILRGLAREQRHWGPFIEIFEAKVPGSRVHTLDLPGVGTECDRESPVTVAGIVGDMRERLAALRALHPGGWGLLGVSLGGMVTMEWGRLHPEDFARLVVINSSAADVNGPLRRLNARILPDMLRAMVDPDPVERERRILNFTSALIQEKEVVARQAAEFARDAPIRRRNALKQLLAAATFRAPGALPVPTLVLGAGGDAMVAPSCAWHLAKRLNAPLHMHPTAGHELTLDDPEWVAHQVASWCRTSQDDASVVAASSR